MLNPLSEVAESKAEFCHVPRKSFLQAERGCRRKCDSPVLLFQKEFDIYGKRRRAIQRTKMNIPSAEKERNPILKGTGISHGRAAARAKLSQANRCPPVLSGDTYLSDRRRCAKQRTPTDIRQSASDRFPQPMKTGIQGFSPGREGEERRGSPHSGDSHRESQ